MIVILRNIVYQLKQCCFTLFSVETMFQTILHTSLSFNQLSRLFTIHIYYSRTSPLRIQGAIVSSKIQIFRLEAFQNTDVHQTAIHTVQGSNFWLKIDYHACSILRYGARQYFLIIIRLACTQPFKVWCTVLFSGEKQTAVHVAF